MLVRASFFFLRDKKQNLHFTKKEPLPGSFFDVLYHQAGECASENRRDLHETAFNGQFALYFVSAAVCILYSYSIFRRIDAFNFPIWLCS